MSICRFDRYDQQMLSWFAVGVSGRWIRGPITPHAAHNSEVEPATASRFDAADHVAAVVEEEEEDSTVADQSTWGPRQDRPNPQDRSAAEVLGPKCLSVDRPVGRALRGC